MSGALHYMVCIHCMAYNQEQYIEDTLEGFVMQQTDFPFIALVVDDCSSDHTAAIIRRYEEEYPFIIKGIYLQENYYSQNKSKGEFLDPYDKESKYIAVCEGDDYWTDPLKLQKQVDFLESHLDYVMCCTAFTMTEEGRESERATIKFDQEDVTLDDILRGYWVGTLTTVFRKKVYERYSPPFDNLPMGDLPLWSFFASKGKIRCLPDVTANYRQLSSSASHFSDEKKQFRFQLEAMRVREYYAREYDRLQVASPLFSRKAHYIFDNCYEQGWLDFPMESLWHFMKEYGHPSGYDRLKHWGLKSAGRYRISKFLLHQLKRSTL